MTYRLEYHVDVTEQARMVADGEATSAELVGAAIAAAEALNPTLNAIIHPRYEKAMDEAAAVDSGATRGAPLAGVPIVVKDLDGVLEGEPYHAGSSLMKEAGYVATETSVLLQRFIDAGAIIIGKTNTPELGLVPSTEPIAYGPAHNPWDLERSPAGSSGGSAAAVAAGIVGLGHAGDGGGSIRLPASVCGLVGLKPSRGVVPTYPDIEPWGGLVARLAVTRTVRDTALALDAVAGPDPLDGYHAKPDHLGQYRSLLDAVPGRLRIGTMVTSPDGAAVDPRIVEIVQRTAAVLAELGHDVTDESPAELSDGDYFAAVLGDFLNVYPVWVADSVAGLESLAGTAATPSNVEAHTWALVDAGRGTSGTAFWASLDRLMRAGRQLRKWWSGEHDLLLTPTICELPWTLGQFGPAEDNPMAAVFRSAAVVSFMTPFNISGQPAISVPVGEVDGLPVGIQLVAGWGREDQLLQVARQLEQAMPWADRRPTTCI